MKAEKRVEQMRRARRGVDPDELDAVLKAFGFIRSAGKGDHRKYEHPDLPYPITIDPRRPLLPPYVKMALAAIDDLPKGKRR